MNAAKMKAVRTTATASSSSARRRRPTTNPWTDAPISQATPRTVHTLKTVSNGFGVKSVINPKYQSR